MSDRLKFRKKRGDSGQDFVPHSTTRVDPKGVDRLPGMCHEKERLVNEIDRQCVGDEDLRRGHRWCEVC